MNPALAVQPATSPCPATTAVVVIIAARNAERFVRGAVESVLTQTYRDLTLIVVDDGSDDGTAAVLDAIQDARLHVIRTPTVGRSAARNRALAELDAPLIAILDADDEMAPGRIAKQVAFLEAHPEVTVVGSAVDLIDDAGEPVGRIDSPCEPTAIARALRRRNCVVHPSTMMRGDALRQLDGYRVAFPVAQDYDLWLRLLDRGATFRNLAEPLTRYRVHDRAVSFRGKPRQLLYAALARRASDARRSGRPEPLHEADAIDDTNDSTTLGRFEYRLALGGLALRAGEHRAAIAHALAAIRRRPLAPAAWGLLSFACLPRFAFDAWRAVLKTVRRVA